MEGLAVSTVATIGWYPSEIRLTDSVAVPCRKTIGGRNGASHAKIMVRLYGRNYSVISEKSKSVVHSVFTLRLNHGTEATVLRSYEYGTGTFFWRLLYLSGHYQCHCIVALYSGEEYSRYCCHDSMQKHVDPHVCATKYHVVHLSNQSIYFILHVY